MPTLATHPSSDRPLLEMIWRMAMVGANLRIADGGTRWARSSAYDRLDPSEKVSVSYFLGMTQAAVMSRLALGYPHLVHVDLLLAQQGTPLTGKRPDFVALDPSATHLFSATVEAKGRTNGFDQTALIKAKQQAMRIPGVRGLTPAESIASEAYFDDKDNWVSHLDDPDWDGENLDFGLETYLLVYYRTVIKAGRATRTWARDGNLYTFEIPTFPIRIRIPTVLVDAYDASGQYATNPERDRAAPLVEAYRQLAKLEGTELDAESDKSLPPATMARPRVERDIELPSAVTFIGIESVDDGDEQLLSLFEKDSNTATSG